MNDFGDSVAEVLVGSHLVFRTSGVIAVIRSGDPADAATSGLVTLLRQMGAATGPLWGRKLAVAVARWTLEVETLPDFGTAAITEDGLAVLLCGDVSLTTQEAERRPADENRRVRCLVGTRSAFISDHVLSWPLGAIALCVGAPPVDIDRRLKSSDDRTIGLEEGLVPGDGIIFDSRHRSGIQETPGRRRRDVVSQLQEQRRPPEAQTPGAPPSLDLSSPGDRSGSGRHSAASAVDPSAPFARPSGPVSADNRREGDGKPPRVSVAGSSTDGPPIGPQHAIVEGIRCSRGHFNDSGVAFCGICGIRMSQRTGVKALGRRPPVGLLVLDMGTTFVLDADYVLGRDPDSHSLVVSGRSRGLRLVDGAGTVSRVHGEIRLRDWDAFLLDCRSANGTYVSTRDSAGWHAIVPERPFRLSSGTRVRIGERTFTFQSTQALLPHDH